MCVRDELGGALLVVAADLTDQDDGLGLRVGLEELQALEEAEAVHRVAAHADAGRLPEAGAGEAHGDLVGERAAARDEADRPGAKSEAAMMPALQPPGVTMPGQLGPISTKRPLGHRALVEAQLGDRLASCRGRGCPR